jgi:xanthosine utilization system XapX-like protein
VQTPLFSLLFGKCGYIGFFFFIIVIIPASPTIAGLGFLGDAVLQPIAGLVFLLLGRFVVTFAFVIIIPNEIFDRLFVQMRQFMVFA